LGEIPPPGQEKKDSLHAVFFKKCLILLLSDQF